MNDLPNNRWKIVVHFSSFLRLSVTSTVSSGYTEMCDSRLILRGEKLDDSNSLESNERTYHECIGVWCR